MAEIADVRADGALETVPALGADAAAAIAALAIDGDGRAARVRLHDKGAALALLARRLGLVRGYVRQGHADEAAPVPARALLDERLAALRSPA